MASELQSRLFWSDLVADLTITSLVIPQGISYAKLTKIPPVVGLYSSFVPPLMYAIFGSSRPMAMGTKEAASLLLSQTMSSVVKPEDDPTLFLYLILTTTYFLISLFFYSL